MNSRKRPARERSMLVSGHGPLLEVTSQLQSGGVRAIVVSTLEDLLLGRNLRRTLVLLAATALAAGTVGTAPVAAEADEPGPSWPYTKILNGQYTLIPLKDAAMITTTEHGYLYRAGQQDSHLVITQVDGGLLFQDSGTKEWKSLPDACRPQQVQVGVAAVCNVSSDISLSNPMLLEVWPRLGDDFVDGSTLAAPFQMAALVDAGRDVVYLGAGDDFVNGAFDRDVVRGGPGNDWIRTGDGDDDIRGDSGNDRLIGSGGSDTVRGGPGEDRVDGGDGNDRLYAADSSRDVVACGAGFDRARVDRADKRIACESVTRS